MIENWVYFLLQCATQETVEEALFFSKDKRMRFKTVEKRPHFNNCNAGVEAFVAHFQQQLQPVIMQNIADYLAKMGKTKCNAKCAESAVDFSLVLDFMAKIAEKDPYWQRLCEQMSWTPAKLNAIDEATRNWFALEKLANAQIENYD